MFHDWCIPGVGLYSVCVSWLPFSDILGDDQQKEEKKPSKNKSITKVFLAFISIYESIVLRVF